MTETLLTFAGLFLILAGFIIGLGAVTVIDIHGFLGRKSSYWTEATTRTHKVTKPLIWAGIMLAVFGGSIFFRNNALDVVPLTLLGVAAVLTANGYFLSAKVSPFLLQREQEGRQRELLPATWQKKILVSFIVSAVGWWGALALFVYYLITI